MEETILYFVSDDEPEATGKEQLTGRAKPFPAYEPDVVGVPEPTDEMYAWSWRWTDHKQSGRFCPDTPKDALIDFRCHHAVHPISEKPRRVRSLFVGATFSFASRLKTRTGIFRKVMGRERWAMDRIERKRA